MFARMRIVDIDEDELTQNVQEQGSFPSGGQNDLQYYR